MNLVQPVNLVQMVYLAKKIEDPIAEATGGSNLALAGDKKSKNAKIDTDVLVELVHGLIGMQPGAEKFEAHSICPVCEKKMDVDAQIELECNHAVHRYCFWKPFLESLQTGQQVVCPLSDCSSKVSDEMVDILMIQMQEDFSTAQEDMEGKNSKGSFLKNLEH